MKHDLVQKSPICFKSNIRTQYIDAYVPLNDEYIPDNLSQSPHLYKPYKEPTYTQMIQNSLVYEPAHKVKESQLRDTCAHSYNCSPLNNNLREAQRWKYITLNPELKNNENASSGDYKHFVMFKRFFDQFIVFKKNMRSSFSKFKQLLILLYS